MIRRSYGWVNTSLAFGLLLILPLSGSAWGSGGHMIVAQIAYARLNRSARARVDELIKIRIEPRRVTGRSLNFVDAAHWPDDVKKLPGFEFSGDLHFVDHPFTTDNSALPDDLPKEENIVKALNDYVEVLKSGEDHSDQEQAEALRFIIHFVGDIHQPLHCATRVTTVPKRPEGDMGGNDFQIKVRGDNNRLRSVKLHSYWDGGIDDFPRMGPNFAPPPLNEIPPAAESIVQEFPDNDPALRLDRPFDFDGWSDESEKLAETVAYKGIVEGRQPTTTYNKKALKVARHQVALAGYRLAALLNAIWPEQ